MPMVRLGRYVRKNIKARVAKKARRKAGYTTATQDYQKHVLNLAKREETIYGIPITDLSNG